ncbi:MAG: aminoacyl-tRNA hydrolase [Patescibacteria group bacterium]|nr:aminoacyl-tRNA hydrolase [Patescibacteria group bacterium]
MKFVVGLGNPEIKYQKTRHNAGFLAVDFFLKGIHPLACQSRFQAQICELHFGSLKIFFIKPLTYMNLSGEAVAEICHYYKLDTEHDLMVLHDDVDLPFGALRTGTGSSAAGHNGVQSIIDALGSQNFSRVRIGIETRTDKKNPPTDAFVLQNFTPQELAQLDAEVLPKVKNEVDQFLKLEA